MPDASDIIQARRKAGQTAAQAAAMVYSPRGQTWLDWEAGRRQMPDATWHLYLLLTNQHPDQVVMPRF